MFRILSTLVRLMAPVLSFTADEVWTFMHDAKKPQSVFLSDFPKPEDRSIDDGLEARWDKLLAVRGEAAKVLEGLRKDKKIGHSLDAGVTLYAEPGLHDLLKQYEKDLPFIFIVSAAELAKESEAPADAFTSDTVKGLKITAAQAKGEKCGRCWMYSTTIGAVKEHPQICGRCAGNLK